MKKRTAEIPAITFDVVELFLEDDEDRLAALMDEEDRQEAAQRNAWAEIITAPGFNALQFVQREKYPMTMILHPSTRPGIDWQLSRIGWDGIPNGHGNFYSDNLDALYKELRDYAGNGATVEAQYL